MSDLTTQDGVLDWLYKYSTLGTAITGPTAAQIARAIRMATVWDDHVEKLKRITQTQAYNVVNRKTINMAVQALCRDMDKAEEA